MLAEPASAQLVDATQVTPNVPGGQIERDEVLAFLGTLILFPPDDTASNLNPGNPTGFPQDPASHGSINLGALFQIPEEGAE